MLSKVASRITYSGDQSKVWRNFSTAIMLILCAYALFFPLLFSVGEYAFRIVLLLGAALFVLNYDRVYEAKVRTDFVVLLFFAGLLSQLLSWGVGLYFGYPWAESSPKLHRMAIWFSIIPIAYFIQANTQKVVVLSGCFLLVLLSIPWVVGNGLEDFYKGFQGERINFQIHNAQHMGMLYAVGFLGVLSVIFFTLGKSKSLMSSRFLLSFAALAFVSCVIFSKTRAVWIGLLLSGFSLLVFSVSTLKARKSFYALGLVLTFVLVILMGKTLGFDNHVTSRLSQESHQLEALFNSDEAIKNNTSIGIRILSWKESLDWIKERPLLGSGGRAAREVVQNAESLSPGVKAITAHLHNSYLDIWVRFGLLGLSILLLLMTYLAVGTWRAWKKGIMPEPVFAFFVAFFPFWLWVNFFESYMFFSYGNYIFSLVGGVLLSYIWKAKYQ